MDAHSRWADHLLSPDLISARQRSSTKVNRLCPFCHNEEHNVEVMQKHVAFHLERIALLALPRTTGFETDNEEDEGSSGRVLQGSDPHAPLSIGSLPESEHAIIVSQGQQDDGAEDWDSEITLGRTSDDMAQEPLAASSEATQQLSKSLTWICDVCGYTNNTQSIDFDDILCEACSLSRREQSAGTYAKQTGIGAQFDRPLQDLSTHWARRVFFGLSATPLRRSPIISHCAGTPTAFIDILLDDYEELLEVSFGSGSGLFVRLYVRGEDQRARIVCETKRPSGSSWYSGMPLSVLTCRRNGSILTLAVEETKLLRLRRWCELNFSTIQHLAMFQATFIALRSQDLKARYKDLSDYELAGEAVCYVGKIVDIGYLHKLSVLYDTDSKAVRLLASVPDGEMKGVPVWTAFITNCFASPMWLRRANVKVVILSELRCHIFTSTYVPQRTSTGAHVLTFESTRGRLTARLLGSPTNRTQMQTTSSTPFAICQDYTVRPLMRRASSMPMPTHRLRAPRSHLTLIWPRSCPSHGQSLLRCIVIASLC